MQRFAAKQLDTSGEPLYYLVQYEVTENDGTCIYHGTVYATNNINKELTESDEAFSYHFERNAAGWAVINKIKVYSALGEELAQKIRDTIFTDLVLNGIMGHEAQKITQG